MMCLTVRQPWAAAMFAPVAAKDIENRSWATRYRGRIAIHVAQRLDDGGLEILGQPTGDALRDLGRIIGTVEVVDCHEAGSRDCDGDRWGCYDNPWAFWPTEHGQRLVHWRIDHPRPFVTPIPARGQVGLWTPGPSVEHLIEIAEVTL